MVKMTSEWRVVELWSHHGTQEALCMKGYAEVTDVHAFELLNIKS